MLDPTLAAAIVTASGGLLVEALKRWHPSTASAEKGAERILAKTYDKVADAVTTNSLRVLLVLEDEGTNLLPAQMVDRVAALATQEKGGTPIEKDLTYRLKFLCLLGLVGQVGGSEFSLTQLGASFIGKARTDKRRYSAAFALPKASTT